ncbi:uncharacterized protein LOC130703330 [Daphnia carinata]|uniref:uncharacterized protein LOC130703330 n=1 Tax=Daphnia carinata TaxID=120202 RepID=UPI00257E351C|nr:uncharacterized protein LOC130703330 [Daphnia carinata]
MMRNTKLFSNKVWICLFLTTVWASMVCSQPNEKRSPVGISLKMNPMFKSTKKKNKIPKHLEVERTISEADPKPVTTTGRPSTDDLIDYDFDTDNNDSEDDGPNPAMVRSISPYQTIPSFSCIILPIFLSVVVK